MICILAVEGLNARVQNAAHELAEPSTGSDGVTGDLLQQSIARSPVMQGWVSRKRDAYVSLHASAKTGGYGRDHVRARAHYQTIAATLLYSTPAHCHSLTIRTGWKGP